MLSPIERRYDEERYQKLRSICESSLELDVLERVKEEGYALPDAAQKTIYDGEESVAEADFFYEPVGRPQSIIMFVDGPDYQKAHVQADDEEKHQKLLQMNYRYLTISSRMRSQRSGNRFRTLPAKPGVVNCLQGIIP